MANEPAGKEVISAKISSESAAGWRNFCEANGISMSAMIEVAGLELAKEGHPPTIPARQQLVEQARAVDIARRARK